MGSFIQLKCEHVSHNEVTKTLGKAPQEQDKDNVGGKTVWSATAGQPLR